MSGRSGTGSAGASDADFEIDVHNLPLGKKRGDESFVDGYRRKGPEGLTRELVVLEVDEKGVAKVAEKVRQLIDRKITSFVVNMSAVPTIAGETVKELVRAKKLAEEKGGYFSLAGAKDAVGGLLKVMGLDKEIPSYASLEKAVDDFKNNLKEQISRKAGSSSRPPAPAAAAPAAAAPAAASASSDKAKRKGTVEVKAPVAAKADDEKKTKTSPGGPKFDVEGEDKKKKTEPASPKFEVDDDEEEKRPAKTAQFAAPKFDEDEEEKRPAKTAQFAAPKFDEDEEEKRPSKTAQFAAPKFDEDEEEKRPAKTAQFAAPKFDEDEEEKRPAKTAQFAAPKFDEDEEEKRPAKTAQFAAPKFDEDDEPAPKKTTEPEKPAAKPKTDAERAAASPVEKKPAPKPEDMKDLKTQAMAGLSREEALRLAAAEAAGRAAEGAGKDKPVASGKPAPAPAPAKAAPPPAAAAKPDARAMKTEAMPGLSREEALRLAGAGAAGKDKDTKEKAAPPAPPPAAKADARAMKTEAMPGLSREEALRLAGADAAAKDKPAPAAPAAKADARAMKTEAMPGLSREEALRLAGVDAAAKDKPAPPAPAAKADPRAMKTEAMPGLSREEALRLASGEGKAGAAAPPKTGEHKVQKSDMFPSPVKEEPKPPARPSGEVKAKTDMMPALSKEDVAKMTSESASKSGAPAGEKVQKTEVLKAYDPSALSDVNTTEAVSRAELEKLAAKGTGKVAAVPPAKGDQKAGKTEVLRAATPGDMGSSKTEMMPGMSREEAMRLASETTNKQVAPKPGAKSTAEIKSARTEMMPGMSKEEAQRLAGGPKSGAVPVQRTEQLKAFDPSKVGEDKSDLKAKRTEAMPGLSKEEAVRLAGKQDPQALRTEMMPGMSRSEAAQMVKGGGADPQALKTDSMKGLDKGAAKKEVEKIEYQSAKTQALGGMTKDEAQREMKTERDLVADRPKEYDEDADEGEKKEAVGKKSPVLMIVGVLAVVVAAVFFFMSQDKKPVKLSPTQQTKVRAAFLDAMNLDE